MINEVDLLVLVCLELRNGLLQSLVLLLIDEHSEANLIVSSGKQYDISSHKVFTASIS